ncbi:MAG TPA: hypothetical protein VFB69_05565 [Candidatus Dormibacteraeota bacterium]|nr:hypothetical protein [Candidatus Dormibacteraeota bacterium]
MSDSELEREIRRALDQGYRPAPWLASRATTAVRGYRAAPRPWTVSAAIAAALIAVLVVSAIVLSHLPGAPPPAWVPNTGFPGTPLPLTGSFTGASIAPAPRSSSAIAYDPLTGQTIMFGGLPGSNAETWAWDGAGWQPIDKTAHPHGRFGATMAFDPELQGIVMIGGNPNAYTDSKVDADMRATWLWRDGTWSRVATAHTPVPQNYDFFWSGRMAYDGVSHELVLVSDQGMPHSGPCTMDTWTFDGADWQHRAPAEPLPATVRLVVSDGPAGHVLALLNPRTALVQAGFFTPQCRPGSHDARALPDVSTWEWTGSTWAQLGGAQPPAAGNDGDLGGSLFGDHAVAITGDGTVWGWTGSGWSSHGRGPTLRSYAAVAVDRNGRLLVFGGDLQSDPYYVGDTWLWDGRTWVRVPARSGPSPAASGVR